MTISEVDMLRAQLAAAEAKHEREMLRWAMKTFAGFDTEQQKAIRRVIHNEDARRETEGDCDAGCWNQPHQQPGTHGICTFVNGVCACGMTEND